jgi:hypothetical protein
MWGRFGVIRFRYCTSNSTLATLRHTYRWVFSVFVSRFHSHSVLIHASRCTPIVAILGDVPTHTACLDRFSLEAPNHLHGFQSLFVLVGTEHHQSENVPSLGLISVVLDAYVGTDHSHNLPDCSSLVALRITSIIPAVRQRPFSPQVASTYVVSPLAFLGHQPFPS